MRRHRHSSIGARCPLLNALSPTVNFEQSSFPPSAKKKLPGRCAAHTVTRSGSPTGKNTSPAGNRCHRGSRNSWIRFGSSRGRRLYRGTGQTSSPCNGCAVARQRPRRLDRRVHPPTPQDLALIRVHRLPEWHLHDLGSHWATRQIRILIRQMHP